MAYYQSVVWSAPGVLEELRRLWLDEKLTASAIGAKFGVSRCAVIGKVHRLGLPPRQRIPRQRPPASPRSAIRDVRVPLCRTEIAFSNEPQLPAEGYPPVALLELERGMCRHPLWMHGQRVGFSNMFFCGAPSGEHPYCQAHRRQNKEPANGRVRLR